MERAISMHAVTFVSTFLEKMHTISAHSWQESKWTCAVTKVLRSIGEEAGFHVRAHRFGQVFPEETASP
jgi:hypothetical protein